MAVRLPVCVVASAEVLELAAELAALGGGDVAVGRCWTGAVAADGSSSAAAEALAACRNSLESLMEELQQEMWPWLRRGFNAALLLLGRGPDAQDTEAGELTAGTVLAAVGEAALASGMQLGVTWQLLLGSGSVCGPLGTQQQLPSGSQPQPPAAKQQQGTVGQLSSSRLGRESAGQGAGNDAGLAAASCVIRIASETELQQVVAAASRQLEAAATAAAADGQPMPALLMQLTLVAAEGQPTAVLHVLQPARAVAEQQHLIRLLQEVADLHQRRREGDHLLAGAKLSPLNHLAAPLIAGTARLFLAADLRSGGCAKEGGLGERHLLGLLSAARHVQAVCAKGAAASAGAGAAHSGSAAGGVRCAIPPAAWLPCQLFLQQLDQRRHAEQHRRAEAAALAAAEADRREKLRIAAKQRRQQQPGQRPAPLEAAAQPQEDKAPRQRSPSKQQPLPPPQPQQPQRHESSSEQPASYQPAAYVPLEAEHGAVPEAASDDSLGSPDGRSSLQRLRLQFQTLYQQTMGDDGGASSAQHGVSEAARARLQGTVHRASRQVQTSSRSSSPARHRQEQSALIAAGVAAAEDVATHVAALQMQAAAEALRADQVQHRILCEPFGGAPDPRAPLAASSGGAEEAGFSGDGRGSGTGSLVQQLEAELAMLRQQAAVATAGPAARGAGGLSRHQEVEDSQQASEDLASLADIDAPAPSLGAMYYAPASRLQSGSSSTAEQQSGERPLAVWGQANSPAHYPVAASGAAADATPASQLVSDFFKSENIQSAWSPQPSPPAADLADAAAAGPAGRYDWLPGASTSTSSSSSSAQPPQPPSAFAMRQPEGSGVHSIGGGSYAAVQRQPAGATGTPPQAANRGFDSPEKSLGSLGPPSSAIAQPHPAAVAEVADVAELLEELEREQRINAALLRQLHEVHQQLEEAVAAASAAAAAAAVQPLAPGVEDPADFNALLAALQLERQRHAATRQQLQLQQQYSDEQRLGLEAQLHTQHRQLLVAAARCRAWEEQSPLPTLFRRYEEEVQRLQAQCQRLEEESEQLARLLAEADLERLSDAAQQLPEEVAAICQEHHRKSVQAQAQISKLQQERAVLLKRMHGAERRDRLAELCRKQAEAGMKASAELRQQLAARERQLEAQSLAAAQAAAEATRLRQQLDLSEGQLGRALSEKADLQDAVESLRKQIALLRGQASRDRVLRSVQLPAPL